MITKLEITSSNLPLHYASKLTAFKPGKSYEFKPGVNIIVGENGCGKSTLLNLLKIYLTVDNDMCGRGKYNSIISQLYSNWFDNNGFYDGANVYADYLRNTFNYVPISEFDSDMAEIGNNFLAIFNSKSLSRGQSNKYSMEVLFNKMFSRDAKLYFNYEHEYKNLSSYLEYINNHRIDGDEWTILMDEPDNNLSLNALDELYGILSFHKPQTQIIAVIHNPLLIRRLSDKCNVIQMTRGYVNKIKKELIKW